MHALSVCALAADVGWEVAGHEDPDRGGKELIVAVRVDGMSDLVGLAVRATRSRGVAITRRARFHGTEIAH